MIAYLILLQPLEGLKENEQRNDFEYRSQIKAFKSRLTIEASNTIIIAPNVWRTEFFSFAFKGN